MFRLWRFEIFTFAPYCPQMTFDLHPNYWEATQRLPFLRYRVYTSWGVTYMHKRTHTPTHIHTYTRSHIRQLDCIGYFPAYMANNKKRQERLISEHLMNLIRLLTVRSSNFFHVSMNSISLSNYKAI